MARRVDEGLVKSSRFNLSGDRDADRIAHTVKVLRPFAEMRLSTEQAIANAVYMTPAARLRKNAADMEERDEAILSARQMLGVLTGIQGKEEGQ